MNERKTYRNFSEFYPFYLSEHANRTSRRLHFVGTSLAVVLLSTAMVSSGRFTALRYEIHMISFVELAPVNNLYFATVKA